MSQWQKIKQWFRGDVDPSDCHEGQRYEVLPLTSQWVPAAKDAGAPVLATNDSPQSEWDVHEVVEEGEQQYPDDTYTDWESCPGDMTTAEAVRGCRLGTFITTEGFPEDKFEEGRKDYSPDNIHSFQWNPHPCGSVEQGAYALGWLHAWWEDQNDQK